MNPTGSLSINIYKWNHIDGGASPTLHNHKTTKIGGASPALHRYKKNKVDFTSGFHRREAGGRGRNQRQWGSAVTV